LNHLDTIVIGVGGMGSATAYQLAKRGKRVLGLDRFGVAHHLGSSHGVNRIIRLAYYEHSSYVPLMHRSYELWRQLERDTGRKILHITGSLDAGTASDKVFTGSLRSCVEHNLPHEVLDHREISARFPGYRLPESHFAVFQKDGGFLLSEQCIVDYVQTAQACGADLRFGERVLGWEATTAGVVVRTDQGSYEAGSLVITAGPWIAELAPDLAARFQVERQVLGWFEPNDPEKYIPANFPVFNLKVEEGRYYGFPIFGIPGFKIGRFHHLKEVVDPNTIDRQTHPEDEAVLRACVARYFPDADGPTLALKTCMFTNSPDEHFVVGTHPDHPQVSIAAGFSGHGFKFCSVIGEIMADLALTGTTSHDLSLFDLERYLGSSGGPT
jgi:sarcosine oxidase